MVVWHPTNLKHIESIACIKLNSLKQGFVDTNECWCTYIGMVIQYIHVKSNKSLKKSKLPSRQIIDFNKPSSGPNHHKISRYRNKIRVTFIFLDMN